MREHVKTYEEAKIVIKQHAQKDINNKDAQKVFKLRALWTAVVGLGVAGAAAAIKEQPALIPMLLPAIGFVSFINLVPLIKQRKAYKSIQNDSAFEKVTYQEVIKKANKIIDEENWREKIRNR